MITIKLSRERQYFLWSVVGPLLALVTILLLHYYSTSLTKFFALTMVLGLPLCWYLKKWGIGIVGFILIALSFFYSHTFEIAQVWHIGIVLSILLTLYISINGFEEAQILVKENREPSSNLQEKIEAYKKDYENLKFKHHNELDRHQIERLQQQNEIKKHQKKIETLTHELSIANETNNQIKETVEKAKTDIQLAQTEASQAKNNVEVIKRELEAHIIKEEHVLQELLEKRKEVFQLRDELQEAEEKLKSMTNETKVIQDDKEIVILHELLNKKEQDLFNIQFRLDSALEDIQEHEKELTKLQNHEILHKKLHHEMIDHIDILKREKELLETTIHKLQKETEQLHSDNQEKIRLENTLYTTVQELELLRQQSQELIQKKIENSSPKIQDNTVNEENVLRRRAEGMYFQLKEQFNEKSSILDETRRQLFRTQESLLQMQRTVREQEQFTLPQQEHRLIKHILRMQHQFDSREKIYSNEIENLQDLITHLLNA